MGRELLTERKMTPATTRGTFDQERVAQQMRTYFEPDGSPRVPAGLSGDGHRYEHIWDDQGHRWICRDCGAQLGRDALICKRYR